MHKSRLSGFIIDCETGDLAEAARFWSAALGMPLGEVSGASNNYIQLHDAQRNLHVEVQAVTHESRVHLDIESDDIEAEVKRLERHPPQRAVVIRETLILLVCFLLNDESCS